MDAWAGAPRRAGGRRGPGPPHDPRRGAPGAHRRGRRQPPATPLPALAAPPPPPSPPPRPRAARTSSPDGGTGTAAGGTHAETAWGASLTDSAASVPPTHTRVLTTSRWQPAPRPADTPPHSPRTMPPTAALPAPTPTSTSPPRHPNAISRRGGDTTTSAPLGRVGRPPAGREGGRATGKEGGGTGEGAGGARDSRETRRGRVESGASGPPSALRGTEGKKYRPCEQKPPAAQPGEARGTHPGAIDRQATLRQA